MHHVNRQVLAESIGNISGWCSLEKAYHIFDTVYSLEKPNVRCVELGIFAGRSLAAFGLALMARDLGGAVYAVDSWSHKVSQENNDPEKDYENIEYWTNVDNQAIKDECYSMCNNLNINKFVRILEMDTVRAYQKIIPDIDVLHIDANHSEWDSTRDVLLYVDKVKDGGIIYMDDEDWDTTQTAQKFLNIKCDRIGEIVSGNICGIYRKKS